MPGRLVLLAAAAALLLAASAASARPESEAPALRPDVVRAWHEPAAVAPHTQWQGFLQLAPDSNVTAASYQVCRVGQACFAPPTPATALGNGTWAFDTNDYTVAGRPVDYQGGWRLGIKWWLTETRANGTDVLVDFPGGPDPTSPECQGDAALGCAEAHYLAFDVLPAPKGTPAAGLPAALALLVIVAALRRVRG